VSVDLLPREEGRQQLLRRRAGIAGLAVATLWTALGAAALAQLAVVDQRREDRDAAAQRAAAARAEVAALAVFQRMADEAVAGNRVLAAAMADEVSWAELLVDLSRGVPDSASFTELDAQLVDDQEDGVAGDVFVLTDREDVGVVTLSGYTTEVFTPGLQELLRRVGAIDGFFQEYISTAQVDAVGDVPVTRFSAEVRLDDAARTGRYLDGLPGRRG
jgi:hypothetical protein